MNHHHHHLHENDQHQRIRRYMSCRREKSALVAIMLALMLSVIMFVELRQITPYSSSVFNTNGNEASSSSSSSATMLLLTTMQDLSSSWQTKKKQGARQTGDDDDYNDDEDDGNDDYYTEGDNDGNDDDGNDDGNDDGSTSQENENNNDNGGSDDDDGADDDDTTSASDAVQSAKMTRRPQQQQRQQRRPRRRPGLLQQWDQIRKRRNERGYKEVEIGEFGDHCVIHIHGFHHSGTGLLRKTVFSSLGGETNSSQHNVGALVAPESEGQHLQTVYPIYIERKYRCLSNEILDDPELVVKHLGELEFCPAMLQIPIKRPRDKVKLMKQWAKKWDSNKYYWIQKTPTMDVVFLEQMKLNPTVHVIVMGHPLTGHSFPDDLYNRIIRRAPSGMATILAWVQTWAYILEQLFNGMVESYAVVNFENLIVEQDEVKQELASLVPRGCSEQANKNIDNKKNDHHQFDMSRQRRRRLHLHKTAEVTKFLVPKPEKMEIMFDCEKDPKCHEMMKKLEPLLPHFGYTFDKDQIFRKAESSQGRSILFSSDHPPPERLVRQLKVLAKAWTSDS